MLQYLQQTQHPIVKRVTQRGTTSVIEPLRTQYWTGNEFKKREYERLKLAHNPMLMAARGTSRVRAMDLLETKTPDPKGHYIITGRGTGRNRL